MHRIPFICTDGNKEWLIKILARCRVKPLCWTH